jgi:hypothetical protein
MSAQNQEKAISANNPGLTFGLFADMDAIVDMISDNNNRGSVKIQLGYEFCPVKKAKYLALELQTGFLADYYQDGNWKSVPDYFSYKIYTYYLTASPKLVYPLTESLAVFVSNDFSIGFPTGGSIHFNTNQTNGLNNKTPMFMYGINAGVKCLKYPAGYISLGYSTYNIHQLLTNNTPSGYWNKIPTSNPRIWVGMTLVCNI